MKTLLLSPTRFTFPKHKSFHVAHPSVPWLPTTQQRECKLLNQTWPSPMSLLCLQLLVILYFWLFPYYLLHESWSHTKVKIGVHSIQSVHRPNQVRSWRREGSLVISVEKGHSKWQMSQKEMTPPAKIPVFSWKQFFGPAILYYVIFLVLSTRCFLYFVQLLWSSMAVLVK